ncbi:MAG: hypothetical protein ACK47B_08920 [Armatimonadota bacterium]
MDVIALDLAAGLPEEVLTQSPADGQSVLRKATELCRAVEDHFRTEAALLVRRWAGEPPDGSGGQAVPTRESRQPG